jgi:hypothetical protein
MTEQEIANFTMSGRSSMTVLAQGGESLKVYADAFEQRGGEPVFGNDALELVYLSNDYQAWLTPERRAVISRLRTDV